MPALRICGNRTFLAGDDLRTYTAFAIVLRVVQIVVLIPFTIQTAGHFTLPLPAKCEGNSLLEHTAPVFIPYVVLAFVLALTGLGLEIGIWKTTGKGSPTQPEKRWMLRPLCLIKMIPMSLLRAAVFAFTVLVIVIIRDLCRCDVCPKAEYRQWNALFATLVITHLVESAAIFMYATYFGCKARPRLPVRAPSAETKWRIFCKCCCSITSILTCCLAGGRDSQASTDFTEIAMILADYFDGGGVLDVVLSDIVVGFRMFVREQKERVLPTRSKVVCHSSIVVQQSRSDDPYASEGLLQGDEKDQVDIELGGDPEETGVRLLSRKNLSDKYVLAEGARFMRYAEAAYFIERRSSYPGQRMINGCCTKTDNVVDEFIKDHLLTIAELRKDTAQIIYLQFLQGLAKTPYGIFIDRPWNSVVVSIRGTASLDDAVADLSATPTSMEECGAKYGFDGTNCFVHAGVLKCAEWIYNDLERHGQLDRLLSDESSRVGGYQLVLTGHSLGAGIASVLSFMLKVKFPGLRCLAFSPPLTLSLNMAERCEDYLTSYVLDTDIVPRLSFGSVSNLRDNVLEMIARIKVSKYEALHAKRGVGTGALVHEKEDTPTSTFKEQLDKFHEHLAVKKGQREGFYVPLHLPGKIVHLVKTDSDKDEEEPSGGCCPCRGKVDLILQGECDIPYAARWAPRDEFSEVIVSSHFLDDHKTVNVLAELERLAELFGLSSPYAMDDEKSSSVTRVIDTTGK